MVNTSVPMFPAPSRAVTVMTFVPTCKPMEGTFQAVVPDAAPLPPLLFDQLTDVTPTLSDAVPPSDTFVVDEVYEAAAVGEANEINGAVVSDPLAEVTDHVNVVAVDCSTPSVTLAVIEYVPVVVGVPEMNPVAVPMKSPGGSPVAV